MLLTCTFWPAQEHVLIRRWEDMVDIFGSPELVNQLIEDHRQDHVESHSASPALAGQDEPSILRMPRRTARNALHLLSIYLGEEAQSSSLVGIMDRHGSLQAAKEAVFECPYLLTKNSKLMRATLPALINVLGHLPAVFALLLLNLASGGCRQ